MHLTALLQTFVPSAAGSLAPRPHLVPSIYLTCIVGSFLPPGIIRSGSVVAIVSVLIAEIPKPGTGDIASDVLTPIQAVQVLMHWVDFYVLHDPGDYKRHGVSEVEVKERGIWERFKWYADLNTTMRGVGWDWEVKNIPHLPSQIDDQW